jgi:hypothetical protein
MLLTVVFNTILSRVSHSLLLICLTRASQISEDKSLALCASAAFLSHHQQRFTLTTYFLQCNIFFFMLKVSPFSELTHDSQLENLPHETHPPTHWNVNDFFLSTFDLMQASKFGGKLTSIWEISDLGKVKFCIGLVIEHDLANHHVDCNPVSTPMEAGLVLSHHSDIPLTCEEELELLELLYLHLIGLLMYLAITTHPDITLVVQKLTQFMMFYCLLNQNITKCISKTRQILTALDRAGQRSIEPQRPQTGAMCTEYPTKAVQLCQCLSVSVDVCADWPKMEI